jgi:hypothetical protein
MMPRAEALDVYISYDTTRATRPLPPRRFRGGVVWADVIDRDGPFMDYAEAELTLLAGVEDE